MWDSVVVYARAFFLVMIKMFRLRIIDITDIHDHIPRRDHLRVACAYYLTLLTPVVYAQRGNSKEFVGVEIAVVSDDLHDAGSTSLWPIVLTSDTKSAPTIAPRNPST